MYRRTLFDKIKKLLFGRDIRVTRGEPYTAIRPHDYVSDCPVETYIGTPEMPDGAVFDIRTFGAVPDDPLFDNALSIDRAMRAASAVGGTVLVAGGAYTTTTVFLRSNVTLYLASGACLTANRTGRGYQKRALVYGENLSHITITGGGAIRGNGHLFGRRPVADANRTSPPACVDVVAMRQDCRSQLRFAHESKYGSPLVLKNCRDVRAHGFMIEDSAYWSFRLDRCESVEICDFVINNNRNVANTDGIDLMGSSHVRIRHGFISTADDGIVMKNAVWEGCESPMRDIEITDCTIISRSNSIKVGTETTHDIGDIRISDCRCLMPDLYPGTGTALSFESVDGAVLSDVSVKNIRAERCVCPLFIRLGNRNRAARVTAQSAYAVEFGKKGKKGAVADKKRFAHKGAIRHITVEDLTATETEMPIMICGYRQHGHVGRVTDVTLNRVSLTPTARPFIVDRRLFIPEYASVYPEANRFGNLPAYALFIRHADDIRLKNFRFTRRHTKKPVFLRDVRRFKFD